MKSVQIFFASGVLLFVSAGCSSLPSSWALPWGGPPAQWEPENWTNLESEIATDATDEELL